MAARVLGDAQYLLGRLGFGLGAGEVVMGRAGLCDLRLRRRRGGADAVETDPGGDSGRGIDSLPRENDAVSSRHGGESGDSRRGGPCGDVHGGRLFVGLAGAIQDGELIGEKTGRSLSERGGQTVVHGEGFLLCGNSERNRGQAGAAFHTAAETGRHRAADGKLVGGLLRNRKGDMDGISDARGGKIMHGLGQVQCRGQRRSGRAATGCSHDADGKKRNGQDNSSAMFPSAIVLRHWAPA